MNEKTAAFVHQFIRIALLAVLFYVSGWIGYSVHLPYINIAFWLAVGVGLTASVIWGGQMGIGIFIGAFFYRWGTLEGPLAVPLAAANAFGAVLQAWLGARLLRLFLRKIPPDTVRDTVKAIAILAGVSGIGPLAFTIVQQVSGLLPTSVGLAESFWVLWLSIFTGVLFVTPTTLVLWYRLKERDGVRQPFLFPLTSLIVAFLSVIFFLVERDWIVLFTGFLLAGAYLTSVHSRLREENTLERSEEEFRSLADFALTGIVRADTEGNVLYANDAMAQIFGFRTREEMTGRNVLSFLADPVDFRRVEKRLLRFDKVRNQEIEIKTVQGERRHILFSGSRYKGVIRGTLVDLTDRIRATREFQQLSSIVSQMADTVIITDIEGCIEYVNPAFENVTGYAIEEVRGKTPRVLKSDRHDQTFYQNLWTTILRGDVFDAEIVNRKKNGDLFSEIKTIVPVRDGGGAITHFVATGKDITERKRADELLTRQGEQMRVLYEASQRLNQSLNLKDIYQTIRDFMSRIAETDVLVISSFDQETQLITCQAFWIDNQWLDVSEFPPIPLEEEGKGSQSIVIRSGQSLLIGDLQARIKTAKSNYHVDGETNEVLEDVDPSRTVPQSALIVALKDGDKVTGALQIQSHNLNAYTQDQLNMLEALTLHVVSAEKNATLYAQVQNELFERTAAEQAQREQQQLLEYHYHLVEILTAISTRFINLPIENVDAEIEQAFGRIGEFEKVDRAYVFMVDDERATMSNTHEWCATGVEPQLENLQQLPLDMFPWWMGKLRKHQDVHIPLVSQLPEEASAEREILEAQGIQSLLVVPLISNNALVGFVGFDAVAESRSWSADSILLSRMLGDIITNALVRREKERSLRSVEMRNSALIQNAPDGIALLDQDGIFQFVSPSGYRMFGYRPDEMIGSKAFSFAHPEDDERALEAFRHLIGEPSRNLTFSGRIRHANGAYQWVESTLTNLLDEADVRAIIMNFRDVTDQRQSAIQQETAYRIAEAAQSAESLQDLYPRIHSHIARVMPATNFYIALYDEASDTMKFAYWVDEVDPAEPGLFSVSDGLTARVIRTGKSLMVRRGESEQLDIKLIGTDSEAWLGVPLLAHGKILGAMAVQHYSNPNAYSERDLRMLEFVSTQIGIAIERKQNEEAMDRIELRNRVLIENAPDGIVMLDAKGCITFASPSVGRIFGYAADEILGLNAAEQLHPDDRYMAGEVREIFASTPDVIVRRTYRARHKDGAYYWIEATYTNLLGEPGVNAIVVNFRDVTQQKLSAESLRQSESRFATVFDSSPVSISITSLSDGSLLDVNRSWVEAWGYEQEEALGRTTVELGLWVNPNERTRFLNELQDKSRITDFEAVFRRKSGELRSVILSAEKVDINGEATLLIQSFDITERKASAELLKISQSSLETAQAIARLGSWEHDPVSGKGLTWSTEMYTLFHRDPGLGVPDVSEFMQWVHPDDRQILMDAEQRAVDTGLLISADYRAFIGGHEMRHLHFFKVSIQAVLGDSQNSKHISGTVLDVTEHQLMQLAIRARVNELTCLFHVSRALEDRQAALETICHKIIEYLAPAMQHSHLAVSALELDGTLYTSETYETGLSNPLSATIEVNGEKRGQIRVFYTEDEMFILPEEQDMLGNIASMLGLWLEQREAEENAKYRQKLLEKVIQLGKNISAITDLQQCLKEIYRSIRYELMFDRVGLFLYDHETKIAHGTYGTSKTGEMEDTSWYAENVERWWVWDEALRSQTGISFIEDYRVILNPPPESDMYGVKEYATLAAWVGDIPVAMVAVDNLLSQRPMKPADLEALQLFAGYAGLAIENARLNEGLEQRVEERTEEVRRSEATYRALFENSNDGIFLLSPTGEDLSANKQALNMLGYTLEEYQDLTRTNFNAVAAPEQRADANSRFTAALRGEYVPLYERTFVDKNGKRINVEINLSPVRDPSGNVIMVQSVVRDISERKKAEEALRESRDKVSAANAALEKASRLKDEFLASMSHELRTPLTGILGLSEALQLQSMGSLNEKQLRALKNIETSGRHLLELINDILDLSKIEAGKLDMQFLPCAVDDICQASLQLVKGMAGQKKINVSFILDSQSLIIRADARRLKQMLVNLLSNAIKFTSENGQIGLRVHGNQQTKSVHFVVWDKGIGIKSDDLQKLFKPFVQLDSSLARQYSGTGLGLSLVKYMAELHGGSIHVESVPGEGSQFTIILPMYTLPALEKTGTPASMTGQLRPALIIEDNELDAEHASRYLMNLGVSTFVHPTLQGAFEKAAVLCPSAIILDINLPDGSGMDFLHQLRADPTTMNVPVVICSVDERRQEAQDLGASGYLLKPYTQDELSAELAKATASVGPGDKLMFIGSPPKDPVILMADDNEMILETIGDFLKSRGYDVIATRSGFELLSRASEVQPEIVLMDIQMPGMDGLETIRRLRSHLDPWIARVPIIAVTALAMTGDREKCLEAGANEYLSKPVSLVHLHQQIQELLHQDKGENK